MGIAGYLALIVWAVFVNNFVLSQFLGICPFMGVSKKVESAVGMAAAVLFVITMASIITFLLYNALLVTLDLQYLKTILFILVIAALVQFVEMVIKKVSPTLFAALGIFLPLITTNCAVLGAALLAIQKDFNFMQTLVFGMASAAGFGLVLILFAAIRERLALNVATPKAMKGMPIALITASILSLAFLGFSGMVRM
ncbi:MAG TPA: electron transport complex subunit RsxA [Myxococcota bacterium]|jgi:electron transport complex protein RnfA|nr:electron transport complex subunit RsxA [Myxococcota bacterium]